MLSAMAMGSFQRKNSMIDAGCVCWCAQWPQSGRGEIRRSQNVRMLFAADDTPELPRLPRGGPSGNSPRAGRYGLSVNMAAHSSLTCPRILQPY